MNIKFIVIYSFLLLTACNPGVGNKAVSSSPTSSGNPSPVSSDPNTPPFNQPNNVSPAVNILGIDLPAGSDSNNDGSYDYNELKCFSASTKTLDSRPITGDEITGADKNKDGVLSKEELANLLKSFEYGWGYSVCKK